MPISIANITLVSRSAATIASGARVKAQIATQYDPSDSAPAMVPLSHPLAEINGALNAVVLESEALSTNMYVGLGAGMMPTASAVVADIRAARWARCSSWSAVC